MPPPGPVSPNAHTPPLAHAITTVRANVVAVAPPAFLAVIVYVVAVCAVVGVPDNNPVAVSNDEPAGFKGSILKLAIAPPVDVTV